MSGGESGAREKLRDRNIRIGPSGWTYKSWRAGFYKDVPQRRWLSYCAARFDAAEANGTFYRSLTPQTARRWRDGTPDDFVFAAKGHRMVTHMRRLANARPSIAFQRQQMESLGPKLAAVVWQLPERLARNDERLSEFVEALSAWPEPRHAIEFRHDSWFCDDVAAVLADGGVAVCLSDSPRWPMWRAATTDLVYVRLHGNPELYASRYSDAALRGWARSIRRWRKEGRAVHVYFDNDAHGHAPFDALRLMDLLARSRSTTRK